MSESANEIVIGIPVTFMGSMDDRDSDSAQVITSHKRYQ